MIKYFSLALSALLLSFAIWGCSQFADSIPATTQKVLTRIEVLDHFPGKFVIFGDATYAEVNPAFAERWHSYTAKVMDLLGMSSNWTEQFDCNRFANVKLAVIHIRFLVDTWLARNPAPLLR